MGRTYSFVHCLATVLIFTLASRTTGVGADDCELKADVVFIVDSSRSIWPPYFQVELDFLANLTAHLNVGKAATHIGVLTFSEGADVELLLSNTINDDVTALQSFVTNIPFAKGGRTDTYQALGLAREEVFSAANGARSDVPHIIIIVTDGDSSDRAETKRQADLVREQGIQVFVVGIGHHLDPQQLAEIATENSKEYVHSVGSFTALDNLLPKIIPAACKATTTGAPMPTTAIPEVTTPLKLITSPAAEPSPTTEGTVISEETKEGCHGKKADVVFVLDKSSSIRSQHFRTQLNFVNDIMGVFNIAEDHTHVSVVTFDFSPKIEFGLREYFTTSAVRQAVLRTEYTAGSTNTFLALRLVAEHVLTPEGGAREGVATVVIVVTDGQSSDQKETKKWANVLKAQGAYVFAIGVGNETDKHELTNIGSQPTQQFVFEVDGYNALGTIQDILASRACDVPSGDLFVRCQAGKEPADVMFVTDFSHAGGRDVNYTTHLVKEVAGGIVAPEGRVRVGLVSSQCPDVTDVGLDVASTAEEFADAVTFSGQDGLAATLRRARERLTSVKQGARKGVRRVAVVFVHGPIGDLKDATRQVMRAKSRANRPGVEFIFVGMGEGVQERQLLQLSAERKPENARVMMGNVGKGQITWQDVLTKICETLESK